jgi:hypothetical protein
MRKCGRRCPDAGDDEDDHGGQIPRQHHAAAYVVRPTCDGNGEADDERQPEIDAEGGRGRILSFALATFRLALLTYVGGCRFWRETVEFSLDLAELDRPIDFAQLTLLPFGLDETAPSMSTRRDDTWQPANPIGSKQMAGQSRATKDAAARRFPRNTEHPE